jgi:hypothetical protein
MGTSFCRVKPVWTPAGRACTAHDTPVSGTALRGVSPRLFLPQRERMLPIDFIASLIADGARLRAVPCAARSASPTF